MRVSERVMDEQPIVLTAPLVVDGSNAKDVGDQLRAALCRYPVVVADLTTTSACDLAGIGELCNGARTGRRL
jgi:hypothetical protein